MLLFDEDVNERRYWINGIVNKQKIVIKNVLNIRINVEEWQIFEYGILMSNFRRLSNFFWWEILRFGRTGSLE